MADPKISGDYELLGNFKLSNPSFTPSQNLALDSNGKVITVAGGNVSIGSIISGGAPNQVLYTDASSQLTQDVFYTRDILTKTDFHGYDNGGFLSGFVIDPNFNGQGVNFAGVKREGVGGSISAVGTADLTSVGRSDNNVVRYLNNGSSTIVEDIQSEDGFDRLWENTTTNILLNERFGSTVGNHIINTSLISNTNDTLEYIMDSDNGSMGVNKMFRWTWGDGSGLTHGFQLDTNGLGYFGTSGFEYYLPTADGTAGQVLTTDGAGNTSFQNIPAASATLTQNYIGFGNSSNVLSGDNTLTYSILPTGNEFKNTLVAPSVPTDYQVTGPSFTGIGLNDLTVDFSTYSSVIYGSAITITIDSTGTPDTFSYNIGSGMSGSTGSGSNVPITGAPQTILDNQGFVAGVIQFGATTGHTLNDQWYMAFGINYSLINPSFTVSNALGYNYLTIGLSAYTFGNDSTSGILRGNGTRLFVNDDSKSAKVIAGYLFDVGTANNTVNLRVNNDNNTVTLGDPLGTNGGNKFIVSQTEMVALTDNPFSIKDKTGSAVMFDVSNNSLAPSIQFNPGNLSTPTRFQMLAGTGESYLYSNEFVALGSSTIEMRINTNGGYVKDTGLGHAYNYLTVSDQDHTIVPWDYYIMVDTLSAPRTMALPAANSVEPGQTVTIKDKDGSASTFNITIDADGTDTIDGIGSQVISVNYGKLTLVSDGVNTWSIV